MELLVIAIVGLAGLWLLSSNKTASASIVVQSQNCQPSSRPKPSGIMPLLSTPQFGIATCGPGLHTCLPSASTVPVVSTPVVSDSVVNGVDLFKQIQAEKLVDAVPPIGQRPADISAWENAFSAPGQWKWTLISDPSVSFIADISGHRIS